MDFGLMFFSAAQEGRRDADGSRYRLLLEAARFADRRGFLCVWTPERHFHPFGGLYPDPAVTSAALATATERLELRAGSLVSPLHDAIRIAESWSMVDNLSGGRAAISFGSGWNVDDFVFFPDHYPRRRELMYEQIETVRTLWRGGTVARSNTYGHEVEIRLFPRPVQAELPVWVTSSGDPETFERAGAIGANLLTHLIGQDLETLAAKIDRYRGARAEGGHDAAAGKVSLMLHTFLGRNVEKVRARVREPFRAYLRSAVSLEQMAALGGGVVSGGKKIDPHDIPAELMEELLEMTFERYSRTASLLGTVAGCRELVLQLEEIGVDEIACLIDFGVARSKVLESLEALRDLKDRFDAGR